MIEHALPALTVLLLWWASTGIVVYLDGLPRQTFRWSMAAATGLLAIAMIGLALTRDLVTPEGAYLAFGCGLLAWGWQEVAFLMGYVTGPNTSPCPVDAKGWRRFRLATSTLLWHELAILAGALAIVVVTWGGANQVGTATFLVLWVMRLSTKLNIFLGVRNLTEDFLPDNLAYLRSFFRRRAMNWLFPFSVTAATALTLALARAAGDPTSTTFEAAGLTLLAALAALAVLEHWFLVLPLPVEALWSWGLRSHQRQKEQPAATLARPETRRETREPAALAPPLLPPPLLHREGRAMPLPAPILVTNPRRRPS